MKISDGQKELKKSQKIPDKTLESMMQKLKSHIIYNMAIIYDRIHEYDPNEFKSKKSQGLINDDSLNDNDNSTQLDNSQTSSQNNTQIEDKDSRMIKFQTTLKKNFAELNKNPTKVAEDLIKIELSVIRSFGVSNEDYFNSLAIALQTNKKIQNDLKFLAKYKIEFENDRLMPINFGKVIKTNFLKIVSNIYYLNLREVSRTIKFNYFDKGVIFNDTNECNKIIYKLYETNLKRIR